MDANEHLTVLRPASAPHPAQQVSFAVPANPTCFQVKTFSYSLYAKNERM